MRVSVALLVALGAQFAHSEGILPTAAGQQDAWDNLRAKVVARISEHKGIVGLVVLDPLTGESVSVRGDELFPTASNIKVPILFQLFQQVEEGRIRLDDPVVMLDVDRIGGSGVLQLFDAPLQITVKDAATLMIAQSDNTATNLIIDKLGIRAVNERMDSLGYIHTRLWAKVSQRRATSIAPDSSSVYGLGVTTPSEMAQMFASLYRGESVSREASRQMIAMLREQAWGYNEIPRYLPAGVVVAHKTGSVSATRNDCGIVYAQRPRGASIFDSPAPGGRDYVICVFTDKNEDTSWRPVDNTAEVLIGELSRIVWEALEPAHPG
jgi:beta-lactamase class A